jgi:CheY-like chemotaxis protein
MVAVFFMSNCPETLNLKIMKRVLIIEDNADVRENTADMLELAGYEIATSSEGRSGLRKAQDFKPDLILCDIMMPGMDGYQVLDAILSNSKTAAIPFIFLTAKTEKSDMRKGMNMGADDYLTKPFEEEELLDAVQTRLDKHDFLHRQFSRGVEGFSEFMAEASAYLNLDHIERKYYSKEYQPRDMLYMEGDAAHHLYYILDGLVKTHKSTEGGKDLVTGMYGSGKFIGQLSLLNPKGVYLETATIMEKSEIYAIPKSDFVHLLTHNREVSHKFMELISNDLIDIQQQLVQMAYCPVRQRLARTLIKLQEAGLIEDEKHEGIDIAREDLAGMVGTATETAIRALSELKSEGIIRMGKFRRIMIEDRKKLEELALLG